MSNGLLGNLLVHLVPPVNQRGEHHLQDLNPPPGYPPATYGPSYWMEGRFNMTMTFLKHVMEGQQMQNGMMPLMMFMMMGNQQRQMGGGGMAGGNNDMFQMLMLM